MLNCELLKISDSHLFIHATVTTVACKTCGHSRTNHHINQTVLPLHFTSEGTFHVHASVGKFLEQSVMSVDSFKKVIRAPDRMLLCLLGISCGSLARPATSSRFARWPQAFVLAVCHCSFEHGVNKRISNIRTFQLHSTLSFLPTALLDLCVAIIISILPEVIWATHQAHGSTPMQLIRAVTPDAAAPTETSTHCQATKPQFIKGLHCMLIEQPRAA